MVDRQLIVARMVVEARRRCRRSSSPVFPIRAAADRRHRLGLAHPRIDANYRSTI